MDYKNTEMLLDKNLIVKGRICLIYLKQIKQNHRLLGKYGTLFAKNLKCKTFINLDANKNNILNINCVSFFKLKNSNFLSQ